MNELFKKLYLEVLSRDMKPDDINNFENIKQNYIDIYGDKCFIYDTNPYCFEIELTNQTNEYKLRLSIILVRNVIEICLKNNDNIIYIDEIGYEDVRRFEFNEVQAEIERLQKELNENPNVWKQLS
jgi:hypothetical protein